MSKDPLMSLVASTDEISQLDKYMRLPRPVIHKSLVTPTGLKNDTPELAKRRWKEGGFGKPGSKAALNRYKKWLSYLGDKS
jgi:hypothetical protein